MKRVASLALLFFVVTACASGTSDFVSEWTPAHPQEEPTIWEKHVQAPSVWSDRTPDAQQACALLFTSPNFVSGGFPVPEAAPTIANTLRTQGVMLPDSGWILSGSDQHSTRFGGGGDALECHVENDGTAGWGNHLPGTGSVIFAESDLLDETGEVVTGWKQLRWEIVTT